MSLKRKIEKKREKRKKIKESNGMGEKGNEAKKRY